MSNLLMLRIPALFEENELHGRGAWTVLVHSLKRRHVVFCRRGACTDGYSQDRRGEGPLI